MRATLAVAAVLVLVVPSTLGAQTWREFYDRGEYEKAAAILHPLVLESMSSGTYAMPDVDATEALAMLYWDGRGVPRDRIVACSFATLASASAAWRSTDPKDPAMAQVERLDRATCGTLSTEERLEAVQMMGCPRFDLERQVFDLRDGRSIELTRRGIRVVRDDLAQPEPLPTMCMERVALVRHTRVDPPATAIDDVTARDFVELYSWSPVSPGAQPQRALTWKLGEIFGSKIEWREATEIAREPGPTWTQLSVPPDKTDVRFEMSSTGAIRWRFGAGTFAGMLDSLPEARPETPDDLSALPTKGGARVRVTVADRFDSPLEGARVTLTGVVGREADSTASGAVSFNDLPEGRYDVVVSAKGLSPSVPRVIDLTESGDATIAVTLKPRAPTERSSLACGGYDARSIRSLAAGAAVVLHVKVTGQDTRTRASADDSPKELTTVNTVQVLQTFTRSAPTPSAGATMTIDQGGGRLDRGEYIDYHAYNHLPPLNVGDDYVLFLFRDTAGAYTILGAEEGTFRIRNARVEPLGSGGAAAAWKGRSAAKFFERLARVGQAK